MAKIYDRNRNLLSAGQRVMIVGSGEIDVLEAALTDGLTSSQAERTKCVLLTHAQERYAPIELVKLG